MVTAHPGPLTTPTTQSLEPPPPTTSPLSSSAPGQASSATAAQTTPTPTTTTTTTTATATVAAAPVVSAAAAEAAAAPKKTPLSHAAVDDGDDGDGGYADSPPRKKRRRIALACEPCRRRKLGCNRMQPCSHCVRSGSECVFRNPPPPWVDEAFGRRGAPAGGGVRGEGFDGGGGGSAISGSATRFEQSGLGAMALRPQAAVEHDAAASSADVIRHLEDIIRAYRERDRAAVVEVSPGGAAAAAAGAGALPPPPSTSSSGATPAASTSSAAATNPPGSNRLAARSEQQRLPLEWRENSGSKLRFYGMSHWMSSVAMYPQLMAIGHWMKSGSASQMHEWLQRCKKRGQLIKRTRRVAPGQALPTTPGATLPESRAVADRLVRAYLRTFEPVHRILHVPSFEAEYAAYWAAEKPPATTFVVLLQLVLAIGACFHDDTFAMRPAAARWIMEAQTWLIQPPEKGRLTMTGLQIMCLLHIARQTTGVGQDLGWIYSGGMLRTAMYMGLHRDPWRLARMTVQRAEMRRRLWTTVLELTLQSSIDAGGPPMLALADFDAKPPSNLDDTELTDEQWVAASAAAADGDAGASAATASSSSTLAPPRFTDASLQRTLAESFPIRLAVARAVNNHCAPLSYEETLRLSTRLTGACRALSRRVSQILSSGAASPHATPTLFHARYVEFLALRFQLALHLPFLTRALKDPAYYYSGKASVDTALTLCGHLGLEAEAAPGSWVRDVDLDRLAVNGCGLWRIVPTQCFAAITMELIAHYQAEHYCAAAPTSPLASSPAGFATADDGEGGIRSPPGGGGVPPALLLPTTPPSGIAHKRAVLDAALAMTQRRIRSGETNVKVYALHYGLVHLVRAAERAVFGGPELDEYLMGLTLGALQNVYDTMGDAVRAMGLVEDDAAGSGGSSSHAGPSSSLPGGAPSTSSASTTSPFPFSAFSSAPTPAGAGPDAGGGGFFTAGVHEEARDRPERVWGLDDGVGGLDVVDLNFDWEDISNFMMPRVWLHPGQ